jgi:hypothetical protein
MSISNAFYDIAIKNATKQPQLVDALTEESPILATMPMQAASHGLWNVYEELDSVTAGTLVDMDGELPEVDSSGELKQVDVSILGGVIPVGEDKAAKFGGRQAYVDYKMPNILRETGNDAESSIFYNNLRAYAINQSKTQSAGGSGSTNYSMVAVHWTPGQVIGLFDPNFFGRGIVMDMQWLNNGGLMDIAPSGQSNVMGYKLRMKSNIGIQLVNNRYVSGIVNIDLANNNIPTIAQIQKMLLDCRANPANTLIYCHPAVVSRLGAEYKDNFLQVRNEDRGLNFLVDSWNGVRFVPSYNLLDGTEATVS